MNSINKRIKELEDRLKSTSKSRMLSQTFAYETELKGLKFAQQEILKMIDELQFRSGWEELPAMKFSERQEIFEKGAKTMENIWKGFLEELKKQIKNG